jgi:hypothetical protein
MTLRTDTPDELWRTFRVLGLLSLWLVFCMVWGVGHHEHAWIYMLLSFAAFFLMRLGERLLVARGIFTKLDFLTLPLLISLFLALSMPPSGNAALQASLWLLHRSILAIQALYRWNQRRSFDAGDLCLLAAAIFPAVGAAWLVAFCGGWMPFGFDALIVLLTAAHFHHAGFTLPLIAGMITHQRPCRWTRASCHAVLAGVPLVAVGITCTHFGLLPWVEPLGVTLLVLGALGVAMSQMRLGLEMPATSLERSSFFISGASLFISMILALGFGLRHLFPSLALTMPQMWSIHGSLNAFGFGFFGLLAWTSITCRSRP